MSKIGADYVGLLVLGVFNAAIGRQYIRSDLAYQPLVRTDVIQVYGTCAQMVPQSVLLSQVSSRYACPRQL